MRPTLFLGIAIAAVITLAVCSAPTADAGNGFSIRSAPICVNGSCFSSSDIIIQQQVPQVIVQQQVPQIILQQQQPTIRIQQRIPSCVRSRINVSSGGLFGRGFFGRNAVRVRLR